MERLRELLDASRDTHVLPAIARDMAMMIRERPRDRQEAVTVLRDAAVNLPPEPRAYVTALADLLDGAIIGVREDDALQAAVTLLRRNPGWVPILRKLREGSEPWGLETPRGRALRTIGWRDSDIEVMRRAGLIAQMVLEPGGWWWITALGRKALEVPLY